jgi:CheY-like chemotaxis protein
MIRDILKNMVLMALAVLLLSSAGGFAQAPQRAAATAAVDQVVPALETNPAVRAALEIPRQTPAEHFQAIGWLIDLGRPELAKRILDDLTNLDISDEERAALVDEFGPRSMLQLARAKELAPAGAEFAEKCMAAASAAANDPQRTARLVAQLTDPSEDVRTIARNDLAATGRFGAVAVLDALARERNADRRKALMTAAAHMEALVVGPLLAMLDTNDPQLGLDVAALLMQLDVAPAKPLLTTPPGFAIRELLVAIERYEQGMHPFATDESNRVELWHWDDANKKLSSGFYSANEARIIWLARLTGELARLQPGNSDYARKALLYELEAAPLLPVADKSIAKEQFAGAETTWINNLLAEALEQNYSHAAVAAADTLGERRDANVLFTADAQPSVLASALVHPNRRVRFAALRAIMMIDPASPYPGSSRVPEALTWFASGSGARQAMVAMPTNAAATNLAGMLRGHELDAEATNRGHEAVGMAREMADLEMIFVDMGILLPDIRQVLYELRISPTTGQIPIALMAADGRLEAAERLAAEHERVLPVPRPHSAEVLSRIVEQLSAMAGRDAVSAEVRQQQAAEAAAWIDKLRGGERRFYTIRVSALPDSDDSRPGHITPAPPANP